MTFKMVLMIRGDIKMSKGKVLAQISHAVVSATVKAYTSTNIFYKWQADGEKIVILKVPNLKTLLTIMNIATRKKVQNGFVIDAGLTELKEGTITIGYVGPDYDNKIDKLTGQLKLY